ncbi:MAG: outer membrane protein assembly factor BamB [Gammaproteobacteria bacterium]
MKARVWILVAAVALGGCGASKAFMQKASGWMGEEGSLPPLPQLEPAISIETLWSEQVGQGADEFYLKLTPVVDEGSVFVADREGDVARINIENGSTVWNSEIEQLVSAGPGLGDGQLYLGTTEGEVIALSAEDGRQQWSTRVSSEVLAAPRYAQGVVVVRTGDGKLFGLEAASGKRLWVYDRTEPALTLRGASAPLLSETLVLAGFDSGHLVALDLRTGKLIWDTRVVLPSGRSDLERMVDIDSEPQLYQGVVYVAAYQGKLAAIQSESGQTLWTRDLSSYAGMGLSEGEIYLTGSDSAVWALDHYSGDTVWKQDALKGRLSTAPASLGPYLAVGDQEGYLHWLSRSDGQLLAFVHVDESRILAPPVAANGAVIVYSTDGRLAAYRPQ